jgi:hypothetical protein
MLSCFQTDRSVKAVALGETLLNHPGVLWRPHLFENNITITAIQSGFWTSRGSYLYT